MALFRYLHKAWRKGEINRNPTYNLRLDIVRVRSAQSTKPKIYIQFLTHSKLNCNQSFTFPDSANCRLKTGFDRRLGICGWGNAAGNLLLVESADAKPVDKKGWLHWKNLVSVDPHSSNPRCSKVNVNILESLEWGNQNNSS